MVAWHSLSITYLLLFDVMLTSNYKLIFTTVTVSNRKPFIEMKNASGRETAAF